MDLYTWLALNHTYLFYITGKEAIKDRATYNWGSKLNLKKIKNKKNIQKTSVDGQVLRIYKIIKNIWKTLFTDIKLFESASIKYFSDLLRKKKKKKEAPHFVQIRTNHVCKLLNTLIINFIYTKKKKLGFL